MEEASKLFAIFRSLSWDACIYGLLACLTTLIIVIVGSSKKKEKSVQEVRLQDLSTLWTKNNNNTIHISELSPLWRNQEGETEQCEEIIFSNQRIYDFMKSVCNSTRFTRFPAHRAVCTKLLTLLDQEGGCSSVVNVRGDVEGGWDENTYQLLGKTSLRDHSLNVAEEVITLLTESNSYHIIPDGVIAALAHDLGKLESVRGYLYSLGEHPLAAGRPLGAIKELEDLPKKEEIFKAIRFHHKKPQGLLGKTLKKADQLARQKELNNAAREDIKNNPPSPSEDCNSAGLSHKSALNAHTAIYGDEGRKESKQDNAAPSTIDISQWFDKTRFINELKPYINKLFGRRFMAFSMAEGHVYFQTKVLEEVARKMAEAAGCMEVVTMAERDESMRDVLFTIVSHLRRDEEIIARGLIKDSFFGGYFTVTRKIGKTIKGYYTPFHAEPFGSIAEMENAKPKMLRDIIKVTPYLEDQTVDYE